MLDRQNGDIRQKR